MGRPIAPFIDTPSKKSIVKVPKDIYVLIPGNVEYVTLCSQRNFAGVAEDKGNEMRN